MFLQVFSYDKDPLCYLEKSEIEKVSKDIRSEWSGKRLTIQVLYTYINSFII